MKIVQFPHPALRYRTQPLTSVDEQVRSQAAEMLDLMYQARGLGLAAPQVALAYQMIVINVTADPLQREHEHVLINPVLVERKGSIEGEEGCLSFPGLYQKVRRAKTVVVRAYNLKGEVFEISTADLEARLLQHEIDHLNGILFIDKMGFFAKRDSRASLEEFDKQFRKAQERGEIPSDSELEQQFGRKPESRL